MRLSNSTLNNLKNSVHGGAVTDRGIQYRKDTLHSSEEVVRFELQSEYQDVSSHKNHTLMQELSELKEKEKIQEQNYLNTVTSLN